MAVSITLYKYAKEANRLDKSSFLSNSKTVNGTFRGGVDMINPTVEFYDSATILPDINDYNYMKIEYETGDNRYYFINDIFIDRTHVFVISGHVDVLMTYKSDIEELEAMAIRSEKDYNTYIADNMEVSYQYDSCETKYWKVNTPTGPIADRFVYNEDEIILITKG